MRISFSLTVIVVVMFATFVLPCQKALSAGSVRYWICGSCGLKTKSLKGYIPESAMYDRRGYIIHFHDWVEVDYETWRDW